VVVVLVVRLVVVVRFVVVEVDVAADVVGTTAVDDVDGTVGVVVVTEALAGASVVGEASAVGSPALPHAESSASATSAGAIAPVRNRFVVAAGRLRATRVRGALM
jgi:hypothetical protein